MNAPMTFKRQEGGFTTPAAALAILVACSLVFVCTRTTTIGSRSGQIQYVADAGALAAENVIAEFVTAGQVVDAVCISLSLLGLTAYAASAVAAFIPGAQAAAAEIAQAGSKVLQARDRFAESAIQGLDAAQRALPAICAVRAAQVIQKNAEASGTPYVGTAIVSPMKGASIDIPDGAKVKEAAQEIESKEGGIQEAAKRQEEAQKREDAAKRRAWLADCGSDGMNMFERAKKLSTIAPSRNPKYSSPERWTFAVALARAKAYYNARFAAEPGASALGSPELIGESVARKRFYAYAKAQVSKGFIDRTASGAEAPHLVYLARNTQQIKETFLYTEAIYPVSNNNGTAYLHAYQGCPEYQAGSPAGKASVSSIDSGSVHRCDTCKFNARTLGRVPSASTSINNGFEFHYKALVDAANDYVAAVNDGEQAKQDLVREKSSIGTLLKEAMESLKGARYDPQPPGRYGCICIVMAPSSPAGDVAFVQDDAKLPSRVAISGATLAPDGTDEQSSVISEVAQGLIPSGSLGSGILKALFNAWSSMLMAYSGSCEGIKAGFRKSLGTIPFVGTALSNSAVSAFEGALTSVSLQPPDLSTYKPVLVNTSHIVERDDGKIAEVLGNLKQSAQIYGAAYMHDLAALAKDLAGLDSISDFLDDRGLKLASIPLGSIGLGSKDATLYLPVPKDLKARLEETLSSLTSITGVQP